jgi:hypothetical protein
MLEQGSSDPTSPRREASLFDLPDPSGSGLFFWAILYHRTWYSLTDVSLERLRKVG